MNLPSLPTRRLLLRPFTAADAPTVQVLASAPEIAATTATIPHPYPDGAAALWIEGHAAAHASGNAAIFAITTPADGVVGAIELRIAPAMLHAELGYWIGVPHWGRGYATEAAHAVVDHAFGALALKRVFAHHMSSNPASGAVLKKVGMKWEGRLRAHLHRARQFHDVELWGLVDDEHEQRQRVRAAATAIDHCTPVLPCADLAAALDHYEQRLGWRRVFHFPERGYAGVARAGATLHLMRHDGPGRPQGASCRFRVRGVDALYAEYQAAGVVDPKGPLESKPWGLREFVALDRDGNALHFGEETRG
ncbi:MAG: GNAT family N-acetyltransferase [Planctomycetes bacterium]|nr:GNAT family N-acetyltransferase [Planctomycetota bacterium]